VIVENLVEEAVANIERFGLQTQAFGQVARPYPRRVEFLDHIESVLDGVAAHFETPRHRQQEPLARLDSREGFRIHIENAGEQALKNLLARRFGERGWLHPQEARGGQAPERLAVLPLQLFHGAAGQAGGETAQFLLVRLAGGQFRRRAEQGQQSGGRAVEIPIIVYVTDQELADFLARAGERRQAQLAFEVFVKPFARGGIFGKIALFLVVRRMIRRVFAAVETLVPVHVHRVEGGWLLARSGVERLAGGVEGVNFLLGFLRAGARGQVRVACGVIGAWLLCGSGRRAFLQKGGCGGFGRGGRLRLGEFRIGGAVFRRKFLLVFEQFEEGIIRHFLLDELLQFQGGHLQQLDGLLHLGGHDERLGLLLDLLERKGHNLVETQEKGLT